MSKGYWGNIVQSNDHFCRKRGSPLDSSVGINIPHRFHRYHRNIKKGAMKPIYFQMRYDCCSNTNQARYFHRY